MSIVVAGRIATSGSSVDLEFTALSGYAKAPWTSEGESGSKIPT